MGYGQNNLSSFYGDKHVYLNESPFHALAHVFVLALQCSDMKVLTTLGSHISVTSYASFLKALKTFCPVLALVSRKPKTISLWAS